MRNRMRSICLGSCRAGGLDALECGDCASTATAHLTEPDDPFVRLDLDDRAHEAAPVAAVRVAQRRLERYGHRGGSDIDDLHARTARQVVSVIN